MRKENKRILEERADWSLDYVLENDETRERIKRMRVEDRIDSDGDPTNNGNLTNNILDVVWMEREKNKERKRRDKKKRRRERVYEQKKKKRDLRNILERRMRNAKGWKRSGKD